MDIKREVGKLRNLESYSERENEIRENIIGSLNDPKHTLLWENYCEYLTEQRYKMNCNQNAINLVLGICRKIQPPGYFMKGYSENFE